MTNPIGTASYARVPLGNGGQNIRGHIASDGRKFSCIDIHGCWMLPPSAAAGTSWAYMYGNTNLPAGVKTAGNTWSAFAGGTNYNDCSGCWDAAMAPSNSAIGAMIVDGQLVTSSNLNATTPTFIVSGFARSAFFSNTSPAKNWQGKSICYDPNNAAHMLFGTCGNSVFYSTDGGTTPHDLSVSPGNTLPGGDASPHFVAIDPNNSNNCYYTRYGFGVYKSSTGISGTYTLMSGTPTNVMSLFVDINGNVWVTDLTNTIHKATQAGSWSGVNPTGSSGATFVGVTVDPNNGTGIFAVDHSPGLNINFYYAQNGTSWISWTGSLTNNPFQETHYEQGINYLNIPTVIGLTQQYNVIINAMQFDPSVAGRLWAWHAIDVCYCDLPSTGGGGTNPLKWVGVGQGIEATVGNSVCTPPGGKSFYSMWDVGCFREDSITQPSVNPQVIAQAPSDTWSSGLMPPPLIQPCMEVRYASDNPLWMAFMQLGGFFGTPEANPHLGYSTDGGKTLLPWPTQPPNVPLFVNGGGCTSVGKAGNVIYIWPDNGGGCYTTDGGNNWSVLPSPFLADGSGSYGFDFSGAGGFWYNRHIITYHPIDNLHYVMNYGNSNVTNPLGVWSSPTGASWTQRYNNTPAGNAGFSTHMKADPNAAGTLYWTNGIADGGGYTGTLMRGTNFGANWNTFTTNSGQVIQNVTDIGFGAPAPGRTNSSKYIWGQVNGVWGYYRSDDDLVTSTFLTANPANSTDYPVYIEGDLNVYGQFRFVQSGSGAMIGSYNYPLTLAA